MLRKCQDFLRILSYRLGRGNCRGIAPSHRKTLVHEDPRRPFCWRQLAPSGESGRDAGCQSEPAFPQQYIKTTAQMGRGDGGTKNPFLAWRGAPSSPRVRIPLRFEFSPFKIRAERRSEANFARRVPGRRELARARAVCAACATPWLRSGGIRSRVRAKVWPTSSSVCSLPSSSPEAQS